MNNPLGKTAVSPVGNRQMSPEEKAALWNSSLPSRHTEPGDNAPDRVIWVAMPSGDIVLRERPEWIEHCRKLEAQRLRAR